MDSSRMRTARLLTVSVVFHGVCLPGVCLPTGKEGICPGEGVSAQGRECLSRGGTVCPGEGVSAQGGVCQGGVYHAHYILRYTPPAH